MSTEPVPTPDLRTQPTAVLCGSLTRHAHLLPAAAASLWARGFAVYAPVLDPERSEQDHATRHRALIDTAALVVVVTDPSGYMGEATASERDYAETRGVPVEVWTESEVDLRARLDLTVADAPAALDHGEASAWLCGVEHGMARMGSELARLRDEATEAHARNLSLRDEHRRDLIALTRLLLAANDAWSPDVSDLDSQVEAAEASIRAARDTVTSMAGESWALMRRERDEALAAARASRGAGSTTPTDAAGEADNKPWRCGQSNEFGQCGRWNKAEATACPGCCDPGFLEARGLDSEGIPAGPVVPAPTCESCGSARCTGANDWTLCRIGVPRVAPAPAPTEDAGPVEHSVTVSWGERTEAGEKTDWEAFCHGCRTPHAGTEAEVRDWADAHVADTLRPAPAVIESVETYFNPSALVSARDSYVADIGPMVGFEDFPPAPLSTDTEATDG